MILSPGFAHFAALHEKIRAAVRLRMRLRSRRHDDHDPDFRSATQKPAFCLSAVQNAVLFVPGWKNGSDQPRVFYYVLKR